MQSINRAAPTPLFMLALFGTAVACVVLGVWSLLDLDRDGAWLVVAGCALYLVTIVVTGVYHVPRNNALLATDDPSAWTAYAGPWVAWNHLRTLASTRRRRAADRFAVMLGSCVGSAAAAAAPLHDGFEPWLCRDGDAVGAADLLRRQRDTVAVDVVRLRRGVDDDRRLVPLGPS